MAQNQVKATRYKSKPSTIEAMQWTGDNAEAIRSWIDRQAHQRGFGTLHKTTTADLWVAKEEKWVPVNLGDYVVAEPDGSGHYPCPQTVFEDRWEPTDSSTNLVGEEHVHDHSVSYRGFLMCADDYCASLQTVNGEELSEDQNSEILRQLQAEYSVPDDQTLACGRGEHDACQQNGSPGCLCVCHNA